MKKKIDVNDLKLGMYVSELDRPWLETPFLFQGFEIATDEELRQLRRYCKYVYIDTESGAWAATETHRPAPTPSSAQSDDGPRGPIGFERDRLEFEVLKKYRHPQQPQQTYEDATRLEEEIREVRTAFEETRQLIDAILEDARLGRNIDVLGAKRVVGELAKSVIRNPDALMVFAQLKHKDRYTAEHSMRVCILALALGRQLGFDQKQLDVLGVGALLHDVGKMRIPSEILNKPDKLTEKERLIMRQHVPLGVQLLENNGHLTGESLEVVRCHHERYDGSGYVSGLSGEHIGQLGHIGAIVDYYDAVTSDRAYRAGMAAHIALRYMYQQRGKAFEPVMVEQFIRCMGIYPIGSIVELNTGEVGVVVTLNRVRNLKPRVSLVLKNDSTPYPRARVIDLVRHKTADGRQCEIVKVLDPGAYGIDVTKHLPEISFSAAASA